MSWKPLGKYVLVRLHTVGSVLELAGDVKYKSTADVIGVGPDVEGVTVGDVVLLNAAQGVIGHPEFGEGVALVAAPLVLAKKGFES